MHVPHLQCLTLMPLYGEHASQAVSAGHSSYLLSTSLWSSIGLCLLARIIHE